jgi:cell division protein FtsZ
MTQAFNFKLPDPEIGLAQIKVIGVGGGGSNAVSRMYQDQIPGVEYIAVNTDAQHIQRLDVPIKVRIGDNLTRGLGVGGDAEIGRAAAEESREELYELVRGADMVFIATGMGGGTGTGASDTVAELAKETGALTIGVVTKPFGFEGRKRMKSAEDGINRIKEHVDTLIVIPNDRLLALCDNTITTSNAFRMADDVLRQGVQSIAELVNIPGEINLDFADVKAIMSGAGPAWMAIGFCQGETRALDAAMDAINSPLLDVSIEGAKGVLFNITGGSDLTLLEVRQASDAISRAVDPEANIIFGMVTDPKMEDEVRVTIIATGLPGIESGSLFDEDISTFLRKALGEENELELPAFLRQSQISNE